MLDSIIEDELDVKNHLNNLHKHGINQDVDFLTTHILKLNPQSLLDLGFGNGTLLEKLLPYSIELYGVEQSKLLFEHVLNKLHIQNISLYNQNLYNFMVEKYFDVIIFSFVLHHLHDFQKAILHAEKMLSNKGYFFILDRIAISQADLEFFPIYWEKVYKQEHEWHEECPQIFSRKQLVDFFEKNNYECTFYVLPHDKRKGCEGFPKTLAIAKKL